MALELYHNHISVCAQRVRLVLAEKGVAATLHHMDLRRGDVFDPAYLKLNPNAVVPTLLHDRRVVIESSVIAEYLDEAFPGPAAQAPGPGPPRKTCAVSACCRTPGCMRLAQRSASPSHFATNSWPTRGKSRTNTST